MKIAYDEAKRTSNLEKHDFDFADLDMAFFEGSTVIPAKDGRWMAIGEFQQTVIAVVFATLGDEAISIISMRSASRKERKVL